MKKLVLELVKFAYCLVLAVVGLFLFTLVLDLLAAAVSNGWVDYSGHVRTGSWPILTGTFSRIWQTPLVFVLFLWIGLGAIARTMLGSHTPRFLRGMKPQSAES
jgi:hypothetical protein